MNTQPNVSEPVDRSSPTLLIVSLVTVLAAVCGVIAVAVTSAGWAVFVTMTVLLAGLVSVARTMMRHLADEGG